MLVNIKALHLEHNALGETLAAFTKFVVTNMHNIFLEFFSFNKAFKYKMTSFRDLLS